MSDSVDIFCSLSHGEAEHSQALTVLEQSLSSGRVSLTVLVEWLGKYLPSPNSALRARGTLLLASLLELVAPAVVDDEQLSFLVVFFRDRMRDTPCVTEVAKGLHALLSRWTPSNKDVETILVGLFADVFVQSHDQPTRMKIFKFIELVLDKYLSVAQTLQHDFVYGYLQMIDGERDPRNLLVVFKLTPRIIAHVPGWQRFTEDLFDVTSCYYPVNFTPKAGDSITSEMISSALDDAMMSTSRFAPLLYPFLLEKIEAAEDHSKMWTTVVKTVRSFRDGGRSFLAFVGQFWPLLRRDVFTRKEGSVADAGLEAVTGLVVALSEDLIVNSEQFSTLDPLLTPLLTDCCGQLRSPETKDAFLASKMLAAAARGSVAASRKVLDAATPLLLEIAREGNHLEAERALEQLAGILDATESSVSSLETPLAAKFHPAAKHASAIYDTVFESAKSSVWGLQLLSLLAGSGKGQLLPADREEAVVGLIVQLSTSHDMSEVGLKHVVRLGRVVPQVLEKAGLSALAATAAAAQMETDSWLRTAEAIASSGDASLFSAVWTKVLAVNVNEHKVQVVARAASRPAPADEKEIQRWDEATLPVFRGLLAVVSLADANKIAAIPLALRELVHLMSASQQEKEVVPTLLALPWAQVDFVRWAVAAALSAVRASVRLGDESTVGNLFKVLCAHASSSSSSCEWSAKCLANVCNKGQVASPLVAQAVQSLSASGAAQALGWLSRGLVISNHEQGFAALQALASLLDAPETSSVAAYAIANVFSEKEGSRSVSSEGTHCVVKLLARQKFFAKIFPLLTEQKRQLAAFLLLLQMPTSVLLGELDGIVPLLLVAVQKDAAKDSLVLTSALELLSLVLNAQPQALALHADTLLPNVALLITSSPSASVRQASLSFIATAVSALPYARIFPCAERVLAAVKLALDDPKRATRRLAVEVSAKLSAIEG